MDSAITVTQEPFTKGRFAVQSSRSILLVDVDAALSYDEQVKTAARQLIVALKLNSKPWLGAWLNGGSAAVFVPMQEDSYIEFD